MICALAAGMSIVRSTTLPWALRRKVPSVSQIGA
jgi:hypothetical protein